MAGCSRSRICSNSQSNFARTSSTFWQGKTLEVRPNSSKFEVEQPRDTSKDLRGGRTRTKFEVEQPRDSSKKVRGCRTRTKFEVEQPARITSNSQYFFVRYSPRVLMAPTGPHKNLWAFQVGLNADWRTRARAPHIFARGL